MDRPENDTDVLIQNYLSKEQVAEMKKKLYEQNNLQITTYALLSLSTMARISAVNSIRWEQIDFSERTINDVIEKEGYNVTLYFSEEVKKILLELKQQRKDAGINCEYVFISKYRKAYKQVDVSTMGSWARKCGKLINVDSFHGHDFRHTMATLLKNSGMPLEEVSGLLNHKGVDVTLKHYIKQDKKKVKALKDKFENLIA